MIKITNDDFSIGEILESARDDSCGAVVAFLGTVRDDGITELQIDAYEGALLEELESIREEAMRSFGLKSASIIHRLGSLHIGDNIVLIVCASAHREEAFLGCSYIIDELKVRAPIWKKEIRPEGSRWI